MRGDKGPFTTKKLALKIEINSPTRLNILLVPIPQCVRKYEKLSGRCHQKKHEQAMAELCQA